MKKKLALLMAAIMTVAMVPMTAFAATSGSTSISADNMRVAVETNFQSNVELYKKASSSEITGGDFIIEVTLKNGEFAKFGKEAGEFKGEYINELPADAVNVGTITVDDNANRGDAYDNGVLQETADLYEDLIMNWGSNTGSIYIKEVDVTSPTRATVKIGQTAYNDSSSEHPIIIPLVAQALSAGEVVAEFRSTVGPVFSMSEVIATANDGDVTIESDGVKTFVEDQKLDYADAKVITIQEVAIGALSNRDGSDITVDLKGNYVLKADDERGYKATISDKNSLFPNVTITNVEDDKIEINLGDRAANNDGRTAYIVISGLEIKPTKSCNAGDVATFTFKSKDFDTTKLEVAKMVEESVTYTVEDDDLPVLWAGQLPQNNDDNEGKSLSIFVEENTGDILNTSRKATFTFPEGIEVVDIDHSALDGVETNNRKYEFEYQIDGNVVTIYNYGEDAESDATDMEIAFILSAAPTFSGDVEVTLGGEFDDVSFKVATVKTPYTVEAKTTEVLIDYRYVPVNEIVITEAKEDLLKEGDVIALAVEKMDFEDAGKYEVTSGDIEVKVDIVDGNSNTAQLLIEVEDESTEASTITLSGLELYLDRTLPVGGYALENVHSNNILWENSHNEKDDRTRQDNSYRPDGADYEFAVDAMYTEGNKVGYANNLGYDFNGVFKYKAVTVNDSYVEVVTAGRDQDDSSTTRKIVITIGATTMAVGTDTVTLDTPAYINAENYTELPLRAVSEAFGATVGWDDASRTVTIMMGQRIVSMTIGSKTMYINGTPVAMNTAPEITNERTFVPVRDLANALGITKIDWNEASATVTLN